VVGFARFKVASTSINGNFLASLPVLITQIKVIFRYKYMLDMVTEGVPALVEGATRTLNQCVDEDSFWN